ncbi:MAG: 3-carboxy-cis,cis-muconate cycloisomerase, partial [Xanthobacteraceae bacterium]
MPTGTIDSAIFRDIFGNEAMRQVWSDENRVQKYLDFEAGLARAQASLKIIPQEACDEIVKHCQVERYDLDKLKKQT